MATLEISNLHAAVAEEGGETILRGDRRVQIADFERSHGVVYPIVGA